MKNFIAICIIISLSFVLVACSEPSKYEVVGTLPEITEGPTETETLEESTEFVEETDSSEEDTSTTRSEGTTVRPSVTRPRPSTTRPPETTQPTTQPTQPQPEEPATADQTTGSTDE